MLDSGCLTCIIPSSHLPEDVRECMTRSNTLEKGINGSIATLGEINCDVIIGDHNSPTFKDINILITSATTPILIGQNILSHNTVNSYTVNNHESTVEFRCTLTSGCQTQTALLVPTRDHTDIPNHNPTYAVQTATSSINQPTVMPLPYDQTLEEKLHWLKLNTRISLLNHPNWDELEGVTNLLFRYIDILGTENRVKGTFIRQVQIPTNGQSCSQRQHPIAQTLEADVNNEIDRMATEGIIEPCHDTKGFNSPVFAIRKKNGMIQVIANFKRTLNKVLVNHDPYPMPRIDQLFHKIGQGNKYFATLNLRSGYWQIEVDERDRHKTAFTWKDKCYQYTRQAFGLTSARQIFSRCVAEALATVSARSNISSYINDNLVHAKTYSEYILALEQLFATLRKFRHKLNSEKCSFLATETKYLRRIMCSDGFKANPEYIRTIKEIKPPTMKKVLQSLISRLVWIRQ